MRNNNLSHFLVLTCGLFFILILIMLLLTIPEATVGIILFLFFLSILFISLLAGYIIFLQKSQGTTKEKFASSEPENIPTSFQLQFIPTIHITEVPIIKRLPKKKKEEYLLPLPKKAPTKQVEVELEKEEEKELLPIDKKKIKILKSEPKLLADIIRISWLAE